MQLTIDIRESALDKVMYLLENLKSDIKIVSDLKNKTNIPNKKTIQAINEADNNEVEAISFEEFKKEMKQCIA